MGLLLVCQMSTAEREAQSEHRAALPVGTVAHAYRAMVEKSERTHKMQVYAGAGGGGRRHGGGAGRLIEPVEDALAVGGGNAGAGVGNGDFCIVVERSSSGAVDAGCHANGHIAVCGRELEGVGEEVDDDLVEVVTVEPQRQGVDAVVGKREGHMHIVSPGRKVSQTSSTMPMRSVCWK